MFSYDDLGEGKVLVLLHGLGATKHLFKPQHELSKHFRLIILDLPNHGEGLKKDEITVADFAEYTMELLDHLGIEKAHFLGLSMGGVVCQEIYRLFPQRVLSLILTNTTACISYIFGALEARRREMLLKSLSEDEYINQVVDYCLHRKDERLVEMAKKSFKIEKERYIKVVKAFASINYLFMFTKLQVPLLVIDGKHDKVTPGINTDWIQLYASNCQRVTLDTGHLSNIEDVEGYNRAVLDFINKIK